MNVFVVIIGLGSLILGIFLGVRTARNFQSITRGSPPKQLLLKTPFLAAGAGTFVFFAAIVFLGIFTQEYNWTWRGLFNSFLIALVAGVVIAFGSSIHLGIIYGYKKILFKFLSSRYDKDKRK